MTTDNTAVLALGYRGGRPLCHAHPQTLKMKNVNQNQAVLAKEKLVYREYSGFAMDFDFSVKNHSSLRPLAGRNLYCKNKINLFSKSVMHVDKYCLIGALTRCHLTGEE